MKKIVFCISQTHVPGGTVRVMANKINYFAGQYEFHVITTDQHGAPQFFPMHGQVHHHDLEINYDEYADSRAVSRVWIAFAKRRAHFSRLKRLLFEIQPDVIVSMGGAEAAFLHFINGKARTILESHFYRFYKTHSLQKSDPLTRLRILTELKFENLFLRKFDKVVLLTKKDQDNYPNLSNTAVIPNSLQSIPGKSAKLKKKRVLAVGRLTHEKGYDLLLEAWQKFLIECPDWELVIVGSGVTEQKLRQLILELQLGDSVTIQPPMASIENDFLNSSVFVLSSRFEGFGMVLIEAMSYGLPCAAFDCPCGPGEIIRNGEDGILVSPEDAQELGRALMRFAKEKAFRVQCGRAAKKNVVRFSEDRILPAWIDLLGV